MRSVSSSVGSGIGGNIVGVSVPLRMGMVVGSGGGRRNVDPFLLPLPDRTSEDGGGSVAS